ncbi:unnamed protein product [Calypogeia fissa]
MAASFSIRLLVITFILLRDVSKVSCQLKGPMTCSTVGSSCSAYLYYTLRDLDTPASVANLFSVSQDAITQEDTRIETGAVIVSVQCLCSENLTYLAEAAYRVIAGDTQISIATGPYEYLASTTAMQPSLADGQLLQIDLFCGCIASLGQPLLTYVVQHEDTLESLAIRFNTSMATIVNINDITEQNSLVSKTPYYIPIRDSALKPVVVLPHVAPGVPGASGSIAFGRIVGIVLAALLFIAAIAALVFFLQNRKLCCYKNRKRPLDSRSISSSSCDARASSGRAFSDRSWITLESLVQCGPWSHDESSLYVKHHVPSLSLKDMKYGVPGLENPKVLGYDEIMAATINFQDANRIGNGAYGPTYFGLLRGQEVAVKKIQATKTHEFYAELKTVCKVHHTNLVELIGYSIAEDGLLLVYEYAANRALRDRLHDPHLKGYVPLAWSSRVQIALDAARGLGSIHKHSTGQYVHRDVNTGNILLDGSFRAKVADFGLTTLAEQSNEDRLATTRTVETLGYLAPECVRDSQATAKSDVYAFGVVLFELITGKGAILVGTTSGSERRSLISYMLSAMSDYVTSSQDKIKAVIDPLLQDIYPVDSVIRMASLGRKCVEEDPQDRPDMNLVVLTLTQVLLASIKWEATLEGNDKVCNDPIQDR